MSTSNSETTANPDGEVVPIGEALEQWKELYSPLEEAGFILHGFSPGVSFVCPDSKKLIQLTVPAVRRINRCLGKTGQR